MRYLVAMLFAVAVAAATTLFLGGPVANWAVGQMKFDSPDQVADVHSAVFMATNLLGMLIGWTIGWALGGTLKPDIDEEK